MTLADHAGCPWVGACNCARESQQCKCAHPKASHAHGWDLEKQPGVSRIGLGVCGHCDCQAFDAAPADWWRETALQPLFDGLMERSIA